MRANTAVYEYDLGSSGHMELQKLLKAVSWPVKGSFGGKHLPPMESKGILARHMRRSNLMVHIKLAHQKLTQQ